MKPAGDRGKGSSLFLVGLDQLPVRVARREIAAERPEVARLHRIAHRAGDHVAGGVAGHRRDIGFEPNGEDSKAVVDRRSGNSVRARVREVADDREERVRDAERDGVRVPLPVDPDRLAEEGREPELAVRPTPTGRIIDQAYQERLPEGMVRLYLVRDEVVGFGHQAINALFPPSPGAAPGWWTR